ncbi:MAG: iron-sulfur cluster assembly accessory protein [Alphaproteobacteria bacterium]|nr:iron-sulfur cluster assembly accessory protein [Alphaproteobacteria bacterium]
MQKIISFTESALGFLKKSISAEECLGMRINVVSGGCSGMTYELNFVNEKKDEDLLVEEGDVKIFVAPKAVMFISGMTMDYVKSPMGGSLVFQNPNAKTKCGCGKSFSVDSSPCCSGNCCS